MNSTLLTDLLALLNSDFQTGHFGWNHRRRANQTLLAAPPRKSSFIAIILASFLWAAGAGADVTVSGLRCEYLADPLGIDVQTPRLTWKISDTNHTRGQKQTGYQVLVASSPTLLEQGRADVWDSGQVLSSQSALVAFAGKQLASGQECFWKVMIYDKDKKPSAWSPVARFSMGLLNPEDWKGPWIRHPSAPTQKHVWFRKSFTLPFQPVSAFVHVASMGYHELYINGVKVDDKVLSPALTQLQKRVHYITYDIARNLSSGENCIALWTGAGWAPSHRIALRLQLNAKGADQGTFSLSSDPSWRCELSNSEDISGGKNIEFGGEQVDAGNDRPGWNAVGFDTQNWAAAVGAGVRAVLSAQMSTEPKPALHAAEPSGSSAVAPKKDLLLPREVFRVAEHTAFIIHAKADPAAKTKSWVWYAPTLSNLPDDAERWMFERFREAGISVAGINVGESYGSPAGRKLFTAFYAEMTGPRGFSQKPVLLGRSRGGLMTLSWAVDHANQVAAFAGIYPVSNLASYPGVDKAASAYEMTTEELTAHLAEHNPIDRLAPLAKVGVPLFAIHGDADKRVPLEANSSLMKERYTALGGTMQLIVAPGQGHNMWPGFFKSEELVNFVKTHAKP